VGCVDHRSIHINFTNIQAKIASTALVGSSDLDCFFSVDWMYDNVNATWVKTTPQRALDIEFARNETFDVLIPELSENTTFSLMTSSLLA
jgi:hypothetical protein